MSTGTGRVAVIGDIGGHSNELRTLLSNLGVAFNHPADLRPVGLEWRDVSYRWPDDLHVVSVGDLVHRGPDSLGVLVLIDRLTAAGQWTQVVGNHEQLYVDRPAFGWDETLDEVGQGLLRSWWADGRMVAAAAVDSARGPHLVTHAGLTHGFFDLALPSRPTTAKEAAVAICATAATGSLWLPGLMLGYQQNLAAGPVWAEAGHELIFSWARAATEGDYPPFHQVHGHSSVFDWGRKQWWVEVEHLAPAEVRLDGRRRHVTATIRGMRIIGIDPDHGKDPAPVSAPLVLTDARVL